ncbi:hypothetical protein [Altericista sp. CCNU0014]
MTKNTATARSRSQGEAGELAILQVVRETEPSMGNTQQTDRLA